MRRRDYLTATIVATAGVVTAGCLSGGSDTEGATPSEQDSVGDPDGGETNTPEQGSEQDLPFNRTVGETASFQNGVEVTLEQHTTTTEFRLREPDRTETDEYRFDTETAEPRSTFLLLKFRIRNTGETEENLLPRMDIFYKNEQADFLNFGPGRETDIEINGDFQPTFGKQRNEQGGFPGANITGWVIDPVYLLPEEFESGGVRIEVQMSDMGRQYATDIVYKLN